MSIIPQIEDSYLKDLSLKEERLSLKMLAKREPIAEAPKDFSNWRKLKKVNQATARSQENEKMDIESQAALMDDFSSREK